jgi:hypothetical protein
MNPPDRSGEEKHLSTAPGGIGSQLLGIVAWIYHYGQSRTQRTLTGKFLPKMPPLKLEPFTNHAEEAMDALDDDDHSEKPWAGNAAVSAEMDRSSFRFGRRQSLYPPKVSSLQ